MIANGCSRQHKRPRWVSGQAARCHQEAMARYATKPTSSADCGGAFKSSGMIGII